MVMWLKVEIDGFNCYMHDFIGERETVNAMGRGQVILNYVDMESNQIKDSYELVENRLQFFERLIEKHKNMLQKQGFKHLVLMTLGDMADYKPKRAIPITFNEVLALYKRQPKFVASARPYP